MPAKLTCTHVGPGLPPLHGARAGALILGSFPSPKSREQGFYYGHPQNRFWPLMAALTRSPVPAWQDLEAKRAMIVDHWPGGWEWNRSSATAGPPPGCMPAGWRRTPAWQPSACPPPARPTRPVPCPA